MCVRERERARPPLTCSCVTGMRRCLDSSLSVLTSVLMSSLQPTSTSLALGQNSCVSACHCTQKETETVRQRQTDRETDRERERQTERERDRQRERERDRERMSNVNTYLSHDTCSLS